MDHELPSQLPPVTNPIQGGWQCIACEYPLIGLNPSGACPECGTRLAFSLRDDGLSHANPLWMIRVSQAVTLMLFCEVIQLVCHLAFYPPLGLTNESPVWHSILRVELFLPPLVWLATWMLATPEYVAAGHYRKTAMCWTIRAIATLSTFFWEIIPLAGSWRYPLMAFSALRIADAILIWVYLRYLATRIPDAGLVKLTPLIVGCVVIGDFFSSLLPRINSAFGVHLPPATPVVLSVMVTATAAFAAYMLARYSNQLTACANFAMENYLSEKNDANVQCAAASGSLRVNGEP